MSLMDEHRIDPNEAQQAIEWRPATAGDEAPPRDLIRLIDPGLWHDCTPRQQQLVIQAWEHDGLILERKMTNIMGAENPTARLVWQSKRIMAGPARRATTRRTLGAVCADCEGSGWIETTAPQLDDAGSAAVALEQPWVYKCTSCGGRGRSHAADG